MIRRLFRGVRRREGQSLIMLAIALPLMLLFVGFVVDASHAFVDYRHLQNAADAASLAAAQDIKNGACLTCSGTATSYTSLNGFGTPSGGLLSCTSSSTPYPSDPGFDESTTCYQSPYVDTGGTSHSDEVLVKLRNCTSTFFGGIVGVPSICESARSVARATALTQTTVYAGTTVAGTTLYSTVTNSTVINGTTNYFTTTSSSTIPGTTVAASTLYATTTSTNVTGGTPQAIFAYAHGGTDACTATTGIVLGGNPQVSVDAVVSNGNVNNTGKGRVAFAGYGASPTNSCGLTNSGGGTVSASKANAGVQNWPVSLTAAQKTTICSSAGATVQNGSTLSVASGAKGIYCSDTAITMNGNSAGGSTCTSEGVTLIAPIVTDPGNAAGADLCPSNLANTFGLTIWMYGTNQNFNFSHNNSSVNGVIWVQNGNIIYGGNSGSTGFYEAQNITISGNSYTMTGSGPPANQTTTFTTTSTPTTTVQGTTRANTTTFSTSTNATTIPPSTATNTTTTPVGTVAGTTTGNSTQTATTGTNIGLGQ